ncbi:MAG: phytoene/squalene synthase family protein [Saprospiraceae bacterium]|nr:phytoene/squalene synthase family protein [Saprospiraceae bacterium]
MNDLQFYNEVCSDLSILLTSKYSTSFSSGIRLFDIETRRSICSIYGFVRLADEIVDSFHSIDKLKHLDKIKLDLKEALEFGYSENTIIHSFANVVRKYHIDWDFIVSFLESMKMDIYKKSFSTHDFKMYVYGSSEVVGLMCLKVFLENDQKDFIQLSVYARKLGSAFQKINFLRDFGSDFEVRGRVYFPNVDYYNFSEQQKKEIELDILKEFNEGLRGIQLLPINVRSGVRLAYRYYYRLFQMICKLSPDKVKAERVSVSKWSKMLILFREIIC